MKVIQLSRDKIIDCLPKMDAKDCRLLLYMACHAEPDNKVVFKFKDAESTLGIKKATINTSLKNLKSLGLIGTVASLGTGGYHYRISINDDDIKRYIQGNLF